MEEYKGNAQIVGRRTQQQDAFGWSQNRADGFLAAVVADGMGGLAHGALAAQIAVDTILSGIPQCVDAQNLPAMLEELTEEADCRVYQLAEGGGSTVCTAVMFDNRLWWATVGDSAIFLLRGGQLLRINRFHDADTEMFCQAIRSGALPQRSDSQGITSYLGMNGLDRMELSRKGFPLLTGDRVLLCTDGVYRSLEIEELCEVAQLPAQQAVQAIVDTIDQKDLVDQDNATILIYHHEGMR